MALPNRIQLPDSLIGEMLEYQRILNDYNRSTTGSASYTNPDTSATYNVLNGGEQALALSMYTTDPKLEDYIFSDDVYDEMKTMIEANTTSTKAKTTTGTASAYLLTTTNGFNFVDGNILPVIFHITNATDATINVDGAGIYNIIKYNEDISDFDNIEAEDIPKFGTTFLTWNATESAFQYAPKSGAIVKNVYHGETIISSNPTFEPVGVFDIDDAVINAEIISDSPNVNEHNVDWYLVELSGTVNIIFSIGTAYSGTSVKWSVVVYEKLKSNQQGLLTHDSTTDITETVTSVDKTKTTLLTSFKNSTATATHVSIAGEITNNTTLTFSRDHSSGTDGTSTIRWQLIEFN